MAASSGASTAGSRRFASERFSDVDVGNAITASAGADFLACAKEFRKGIVN